MLNAASPGAVRVIEPTWAFAAFVGGYFALGLATLTPEHRWGDDWAQYVLHARNLVAGHPYPDTGYLFNPDFPNVGPASYPPGVPLLLAPVVALFGTSIVALKAVGLACVALALLVARKVVAPMTGGTVATVGLVLLALHPVMWQQRQHIQSEAPYLLFSMLALWWGMRETAASPGYRAAVAGVVLGVLLYASIVCRSVGIALLPALLVFGWAQRKPWGWFAGLTFSFLLLLWLQSIWLVDPPTYRSELRAPTVGTISAKPWGYVVALSELLPLPAGLAPVAAVAVALAALVGTGFALWAAPRADGSLRGLAARVPLALWYLGSYLSALLLASIVTDPRLLVPVMPIVIPLAVLGVRELAMRLKGGPWILGIAALACVAYLLALQASGRLTRVEQMATCADCKQMFAFVRTQTPPDSVIVFAKPRAMALLGERRSTAPSPRYSSEELDRWLARQGASIVVEGRSGTEFSWRFPPIPALAARMHRPDVDILFRNESFVVFQLGARRPAT